MSGTKPPSSIDVTVTPLPVESPSVGIPPPSEPDRDVASQYEAPKLDPLSTGLIQLPSQPLSHPILAPGRTNLHPAPPDWVRLSDVPEGTQDHYSHKAERLAEAIRMGIDCVPGALCLSTDYMERILHGKISGAELRDFLQEKMTILEQIPDIQEDGLHFGDHTNPLVISVRSGGPTFMAGVLPTIQGVGLNDETVKGLGKILGDPGAAEELYLLYLESYAIFVRGINSEKVVASYQNVRKHIAGLKSLIENETDSPFPQDTMTQLGEVVRSITLSWDHPQAIAYREERKIRHRPITAAILQRQRVGLGKESAAAVIFGRDAVTGEKKVTGRWLSDATGVDIMTGGGEVPEKINNVFKQRFSAEWRIIERIVRVFEENMKTPPELEIIIEKGKVYLLQVRPMFISTPIVATRIYLDMYKEELLTNEEVVSHMEERDHTGASFEDNLYVSLLKPAFEYTQEQELLTGSRPEAARDIAIGPVIWDLEALLSTPRNPDQKYIFILRESLDARDTERVNEIFNRIAGMVALQHPGNHFYPQAALRHIPVISDSSVITKLAGGKLVIQRKGIPDVRIPNGYVVSLDAHPSRPDGSLLLGEAKKKHDREIALYLRHRLGQRGINLSKLGIEDFTSPEEEGVSAPRSLGGMTGDKARAQAEDVEAIWTLKDQVEAKRRIRSMEDLMAILTGAEMGDSPLLRLWKIVEDVHWVHEEIDDGPPPVKHFEFEPHFSTFLMRLFEERPSILSHALISTYFDEHAKAISIFLQLPEQLQVPALEHFVTTMEALNRSPGHDGGIYIFTRLLEALQKKDEALFLDLFNKLSSKAIRYFLIENFNFRNSLRGISPTLERKNELQGIAQRHPLFRATNLHHLLQRLAYKTVRDIENDTTLSEKFQVWFRNILHAPILEEEVPSLIQAKEALLNQGLLNERGPDANLLIRHGGSRINPDIYRFGYVVVDERRFAEAVEDLWIRDNDSPKKLVHTFLSSDEYEHFFMLQMFHFLPDAVKLELLNEFPMVQVKEGVSLDDEIGHYAAYRLFVALLGYTVPPPGSFSEDLLRMLIAQIKAFAGSGSTKGRGDDTWIKLQPDLGPAGEVLLKVLNFFTPEQMDAYLKNEEILAPNRLWLGSQLGREEEIRDYIEAERRCNTFNLDTFKNHPDVRAGSASSIAKHAATDRLPIPRMEELMNFLEDLGWIHYEFDVNQDAHVRKKESHEHLAVFVRRWADQAMDRLVSVYVQSGSDDQDLARELFTQLNPVQQIDLVNKLAQSLKEHEPGPEASFFLLSRLFSTLVGDQKKATPFLMTMEPDALNYLLRDLYTLLPESDILSRSRYRSQHYDLWDLLGFMKTAHPLLDLRSDRGNPIFDLLKGLPLDRIEEGPVKDWLRELRSPAISEALEPMAGDLPETQVPVVVESAPEARVDPIDTADPEDEGKTSNLASGLFSNRSQPLSLWADKNLALVRLIPPKRTPVKTLSPVMTRSSRPIARSMESSSRPFGFHRPMALRPARYFRPPVFVR